MDLLATLGDAATSVMSGGVFGLVGNVATKVASYFESEQQFRQQQAQLAGQVELIKLQQSSQTQATQGQIAVANTSGGWDGLSESLKAEASTAQTYPWVNAVRALVRPALTFGLSGFLCAAFFALPQGDATRAYVASSLVFAAVTSIVWWFGDRAPSRRK